MKKSIVYIISRLDFSKGFIELFDRLYRDNVDFKIILINPGKSLFYQSLKERKYVVEEYYYDGKKDILTVVLKVLKFFKKNKPDIIHAHLLDAGFIGGFAGWLANIPLRIYTRHHGDMHFYENKVGRVYDKVIHSFYHKIIALSSGHHKLLSEKEGLKNKVVLIPNFVDEKMFIVDDNTKLRIKEKYNIQDSFINIGINARWTEWKGVHYAIIAVKNLLMRYSNIRLFLFNASGDYALQIQTLLAGLNSDCFKVVKFENEMMAVYKNLNFFVHVPIRETAESFGLVYIEAMGSGLPCVFTLSGIACDIVVDKKNAIVVPYESSESIEKALDKLISDKNFQETITSNYKVVTNTFTLDKHIIKLKSLYS